MQAIEIEKLTKQYKNGVKALDELSLKVNSGEIFSLLGPNGAGKSSLINILTTFYKPTSGKVTMLGKDLCKEPAGIRAQIACVAQRVSIDEHLSLIENMILQSRLYKVEPKAAKERIRVLIHSFGLSGYVKYPTASYSGGVKRRLDIAMNLVSMPKILFLDEPSVGMDIESRKALWEMLLNVRKEFGTTIFLTTHYLEEADKLSDTICIMKDGKELAQGTLESLRGTIRQNILRIVFSNEEKAREQNAALGKFSPVKFTVVRGNAIFAGVDDSRAAFPIVSQKLLENHTLFDGIEIVQPSLEDIFLTLTSPSAAVKGNVGVC
ncbi:MAG: ABC transporter ATP-binding protein [Ruminococcaceae bacterium]|nr:ABC transporter ATP-binding protein [Oscillospiraceae bacterium]